MMHFDSYQAEKLKKMISDKKLYLPKITNQFTFRQVQSEILFLDTEILPIVMRNTNLIHSEFSNFSVRAFDTALQFKCNGLLMYQPIDENYVDRPIIGVINSRANQNYGSFGAMEIYMDNMDGMGAKVKPFNLLLNGLM